MMLYVSKGADKIDSIDRWTVIDIYELYVDLGYFIDISNDEQTCNRCSHRTCSMLTSLPKILAVLAWWAGIDIYAFHADLCLFKDTSTADQPTHYAECCGVRSRVVYKIRDVASFTSYALVKATINWKCSQKINLFPKTGQIILLS